MSKFVAGQSKLAELAWGIAISPDESRLAIGFGSNWNFDTSPQHVVVMEVDNPHSLLRRFEFNSVSQPLTHGRSIVWSPSGKTLMVRSSPPIMLRLDGEVPCSFDEDSDFGGFLSEDRMVLYRGYQAQIKIIRADCGLSDAWWVDGLADVIDTSPEKGLLAINSHAHSAIGLVDAQSHQVSHRWPWKTMDTFRGGLVFADRGEAVCTAFVREDRKPPDAACWKTKTGEKVAEHDKISVDHDAIESAAGDLLAMTDYKYISHQGPIWKFFDLDNDYTVARRQLIWNFRTGKEVASWGEWGVAHQPELWGKDPQKLTKIDSRFVMCLSSTGKYLAEAGSGTLSMFAIEP